jgi:D-alanyl-D-alanine carboxypeptidase
MNRHRTALVLLGPFSLAAASILFGPHPAARADAVDDYVTAEIAKRRIPGLSLAVWKDGQVVKVGAYGKADLELDVPVAPRTVFQIQSITKTFTSTAILLLAGEGKLSLDDPVGRHLEGTPDAWKEIALRHLLTHTSGIPDFINRPTASLRLEVTEEEVLKATAARPLDFAPGERWAYSNTNYHLLAMVIRKATGRWYGDFLRERLFEPLGMADTRVYNGSAIVPGRASGYRWQDGGFRRGDFVAESILSYGGGGILSTAPDLVRWAAAFDSEALLPKAKIAEAWTPAKLKDGKTASYGLGWGVGSTNGHREVAHGGGHVTGFASFLILFPDDRLAVAVLTNANGANAGAIAHRVAALFVPALAIPKPQPIEDKEPEVTALLKDCAAKIPTWELDPGKFTPAMWKVPRTRSSASSSRSPPPGRSRRSSSCPGPSPAACAPTATG